jgi:hypothetical protein
MEIFTDFSWARDLSSDHRLRTLRKEKVVLE